MSDSVLDQRTTGPRPAIVVPLARSAWTALTFVAATWLARSRRSASIAHLDDRLLADAGFKPSDLGFGERLIRQFVAGGEIWSGDGSGR